MKKSDLKPGYVVQYRNGILRMVMQTRAGRVLSASDGFNELWRYTDDLCETSGAIDLDIISVYGFSNTCNALVLTTDGRELLWSREEPSKDTEPLIIQQNFNDFAKAVHENAINHGWYDDKRSFGEIVALCHSELSEALEEYRSGKPMAYYYPETPCKCNLNAYATDLDKWNGEKLEGIATEMIDCLIRILDWCGSEGIDVDKLVRLKHEYNKSRPYKHGGKVI